MESRPLHNDSEEGGGPQKRGGEEVRKVVTEGKKNMLKGGESSTSLMKFCGENLLIKYGNAVITPTQLIEFQQQAVIFKHMKAGLPLPLHLVIPIWKSVAGSFGSDVGTFYKRYPSFVGFSAAEFDYMTMMDLESGRCRRTDGKKWRCSKDVVPNQKYCERHMHRGRQHSRKLVEASEIVSHYGTISDSENLKTAPSYSQNDSNPQSPLPLSVIPPSNSKILTAISALSQHTATSSRNTENVITTSTSSKDAKKNNVLFSGINNSKDCIRGSIDANSTITIAAETTLDTTISIATLSTVTSSSPTIMTITTIDEDNDVCSGKTPAITIPITVATAAATAAVPTSDSFMVTNISAANKTNNSNNNKNNCNIGSKCSGSNCIGINSMMNINNKSENNGNRYVSAGLGFSPKSVLQVRGCGSSCLYRSDMELEPGRCRRTDGKKWRCSKVVVPDQKYCGRHMHRGAKKRVEGSQPVTTFVEKSPTITSSVCLPRAMTISNEADSATPNTNLSISIPASPRLVNNDERSPTGSSDATISDTTITAYENSNLCS